LCWTCAGVAVAAVVGDADNIAYVITRLRASETKGGDKRR